LAPPRPAVRRPLCRQLDAKAVSRPALVKIPVESLA